MQRPKRPLAILSSSVTPRDAIANQVVGLISVNRWGPVLPTSLKFDDRPLLQLVGLIEDDGVHIHHGSTGVIMGRNAEPVTAVGADLVDIVDSLF